MENWRNKYQINGVVLEHFFILITYNFTTSIIMSRGSGGRGGRGGGRGRFSGRGSVTQDLIRDNLEDLGLDAFHHVDDRNPQPLFPMVPIPVPVDISSSDRYLITKMRETMFRLQKSPFVLKRKVEEDDIHRYSDKYRKDTVKISARQKINEIVSNIQTYIPQELLDSNLKTSSNKKKKDDGFQDLEKAENAGKSGDRDKDKPKGEDESDEENNEELDEDIDDDDDDYLVDHYASDNDDGGGGGGDDGDGDAIY